MSETEWEIHQEIETSKAWQAHLLIQQLESSYFIYQRNYDEFKRVPAHFQGTEHPLENPAQITDLRREIARLIQNLVASAKALVEHTRRLINKAYPNSEFLALYTAEVQMRFTNDPLVQFVEGLRNYTIHRSYPPISVHLGFGQNPSPLQAFSLRKASLMQWPGWKGKGRSYLTAIEEGGVIMLEPLMDTYHQQVQDFHRWREEKLREMHRDDLIWLSQKQAQLKALRGAS